MGILLDITPLRASVPFRKLYVGTSLAAIGSWFTSTTIGLQVYQLTGSTFAVGQVGIAGFIPLVVTGLWGGALVDAFDRKKVALYGAYAMWAATILTWLQAFLGNTHVRVLYALVALNTAAFGIEGPARSAIYPRILPALQLPAANALNSLSMSLSMLVGPVLAGVVVNWWGYSAAYLVNVVMTVFVIGGLGSLPAIPPLEPTERKVPGLRSVIDGFVYLGTRPNIRMTFFTDFCAMIIANPRSLLPAVALSSLHFGPQAFGILSAGTAVGAVVAATFSGKLGSRIHQGRWVVIAVALWGVAVFGFGVSVALSELGITSPTTSFWLAFACLGFAGGFDTISMVFRNTILQTTADDSMRGHLQGIFVVVVAGGPRLGDFVMGTMARLTNEWAAAMIGGLLCVILVSALTAWQRGFWAYDSRKPTP